MLNCLSTMCHLFDGGAKKATTLLSSIFLGALLGSCEYKGSSMEKARDEVTLGGVAGSSEPKVNPAPSTGYRIHLSIDDAPGTFEIIEMGAQFDVRNEDQCGKIKPMTGTPGRLTTSALIPFTRISDGEYEGVVYLDGMVDEDYFGRGVCHWELSLAYADLIAKDEEQDANFSIVLDIHDIVNGGSSKRYYPSQFYQTPEGFAGARMTGHDSQDRYLPDVRSSLFSLTLSSMGEAR